MQALFERFTISLTRQQAASASHPGPCDTDVATLLACPKVARQLERIPPEAIRAELAEYGAWDDTELADDAANRARILWIAAGHVAEGRD